MIRMFNHIKDHCLLPRTPKIPVFFLTIPISFDCGGFIYQHAAESEAGGAVTSLLGAAQRCSTARLCPGTPSADAETPAGEIPSVFIKEVMIQLINHSANVFGGSKVLIILLKTNTVF